MSTAKWLADQRSLPSFLANFDSATTLCRALAWYLDGEDFPALGLAPASIASILPAGNYLPHRVRQWLYQRGTASEAIDPDSLEDVRLEAIREWVVDQYPEREYPAVLVGSANGAAVHLAALLGIPWLPQTFLIPVRRNLNPDAATEAFEWAKRATQPLLDANPDLKLHHMHDPNQDRVPLERMAYFRVKSLRLGPAYERFLKSVLSADGTIILLECDQRWPVTKVDDRHVFQFGGIGGLRPEEYFEGSCRVSSFLERHGAEQSQWDPPEPNDDQPEAEWGFDPALRKDTARFADVHGYRVQRLVFDHVRHLSPLVADLYRAWYETAGIPNDRLVIDSFAQIEPWWMLKTGSVPYWLPFMTNAEAQSLDKYLETTAPYDQIYVSLFSHGLESIGLAPPDRWRSIMDRAREYSDFLGTNPEKYPADYSTYVRYNNAFQEEISERYPLVEPVPLERVKTFIHNSSDYPVELRDFDM